MAGQPSLKRVILAGGGHAHLAVLADWAARDLPGTERVLVTRARHLAYSGMVPGWMTGRYRRDELLIDLAPLAERAGARLVLDEVIGLDPEARTVRLASGQSLDFDLLSLATGGTIAAGAWAGSVLPVRPIEAFMAGWEAFCAKRADRRITVIGGGAAGVELALAACQTGAVQLAFPPGGFMPGHSAAARRLVRAALARRGVTLAEGLTAAAPADLTILATGSVPPDWLAQTDLACDAAGFALIGAELRSVSHPAILAAGDIAARADRNLARAGVHAVKAGPVLAANLRAALAGTALRQYQPGPHSLALLATGDGRAIASWGGLAAEGRWLWRLKDWIDRGFVARYSR